MLGSNPNPQFYLTPEGEIDFVAIKKHSEKKAKQSKDDKLEKKIFNNILDAEYVNQDNTFQQTLKDSKIDAINRLKTSHPVSHFLYRLKQKAKTQRLFPSVEFSKGILPALDQKSNELETILNLDLLMARNFAANDTKAPGRISRLSFKDDRGIKMLAEVFQARLNFFSEYLNEPDNLVKDAKDIQTKLSLLSDFISYTLSNPASQNKIILIKACDEAYRMLSQVFSFIKDEKKLNLIKQITMSDKISYLDYLSILKDKLFEPTIKLVKHSNADLLEEKKDHKINRSHFGESKYQGYTEDDLLDVQVETPVAADIIKKPIYHLQLAYPKSKYKRLFEINHKALADSILFEAKSPLTDIQKLLSKDFDIMRYRSRGRTKHIARCYAARLELLKALIPDEKTIIAEIDSKLKKLNETLPLYYSDDAKKIKVELIHLADDAYNTIVDIYNRLPSKQKYLLQEMSVPGNTHTFLGQQCYIKTIETKAKQYQEKTPVVTRRDLFQEDFKAGKATAIKELLSVVSNLDSHSKYSFAKALDREFKFPHADIMAELDILYAHIKKEIPNLEEADDQFKAFFKKHWLGKIDLDKDLLDTFNAIPSVKAAILKDPTKRIYIKNPEANIKLQELKKSDEVVAEEKKLQADILAALTPHAHRSDQWNNIMASIPPDPVYGRNILDQPVIKAYFVEGKKDREIPQQERAQYFSREIFDSHWLAGKGAGGAQDAGPAGGWYNKFCIPDEKSNVADKSAYLQREFIKREKEKPKNIIEVFVGGMKTLFVSDLYIARTYSARTPGWDVHASDRSNQVYAVSVHVNFVELWRVAGFNKRPSGLKMTDIEMIRLKGEAKKRIGEVIKHFIARGYEGFEECIMGAWLTGDHDIHTGNLGIDFVNKRFINLDHAGGLGKGAVNKYSAYFGPSFNPDKMIWWDVTKHLIVKEPTSHETEYPSELLFSLKMAAKLEEKSGLLAEEDIKKEVQNLIHEIKDHDNKTLKEFVESRLGIPDFKPIYHNNVFNRNATLNELQKVLQSNFFSRVKSAERLALEIRISHCFKWSHTQNTFVLDPDKKETLIDLIKKNPNYFENEDYRFFGEEITGRTFFGGDDIKKKSENKNIKKEILALKESVLTSELTSGIKKIFAHDFKQNPLDRARYLMARLSIIDQLSENPSSNHTNLIKALDDYQTLCSKSKEYLPHLMTVSDQVYQALLKVYENLSTLQKAKVIELFQKAEDLATLEKFQQNPGQALKYFSVENSSLAINIKEALQTQLDSLVNNETIKEEQKRNIETKLDDLDLTIRELKQGKSITDHTPLKHSEILIQTIRNKINTSQDHKDLKHLPETKIPQRDSIYTKKSKLHAIPIECQVKEGKRETVNEALVRTVPNVAVKDKTIQLQTPEVKAQTEKHLFCPDPADPENQNTPNDPKTGFLYTQYKSKDEDKITGIKIQNIKSATLSWDEKLNSLATTLANNESLFKITPPFSNDTKRQKFYLMLKKLCETRNITQLNQDNLSILFNVIAHKVQAENCLFEMNAYKASLFGREISPEKINKAATQIYKEFSYEKTRCHLKPEYKKLPDERFLVKAELWFNLVPAHLKESVRFSGLRADNITDLAELEAMLIVAANRGYQINSLLPANFDTLPHKDLLLKNVDENIKLYHQIKNTHNTIRTEIEKLIYLQHSPATAESEITQTLELIHAKRPKIKL